MSTTDLGLKNNLFPVIGKDVTLHRQPCGIMARVPYGSSHAFRQPETFELNQFASEIIFLCNGRNSIEKIFYEIQNKYFSEKFDIIKSSKIFFINSFSKNILELHDSPLEREFKISGSSEYYSPSHIAVEVTDGCNLKCKHCYRNSSPQIDNRLPTNKLLEILKEMSDNGVSIIELTGGEPTYHPEIKKIVEYCYKYFSTISILSNGWFIDEEFGEMLSNFKDKIFVQVDLDGDVPEVHDTLRGVKGSFNNALNAIRVLVKNKVMVRAAMNVYPGNYKSIKSTFYLAKDLGANWFGLTPLMDVGRGKNIEQFSIEQIKMVISLAEEFSNKYPKFFFVSKEIERKVKGIVDNCGAGSCSMVLGPTGEIRPCLILAEKYFSFGNLTNISYTEFLKSVQMSYFYHLKAPNTDICQQCNFFTFCAGCLIGPVYAKEKAKRDGVKFYCKWDEINRFMSKINFG